MKGYENKPDMLETPASATLKDRQENTQDVSTKESKQDSHMVEDATEAPQSDEQETSVAKDVATGDEAGALEQDSSVAEEVTEQTPVSEDASAEETHAVDHSKEPVSISEEATEQPSTIEVSTGEQYEEAYVTADGVYLPPDAMETSTQPAETARGWRRFIPSSREGKITAIAFWSVIILAGVLRFWFLDNKPLHHDESLHAFYSRMLLLNNIEAWGSCWNPVNSCYRYNPLLHGPFQFHAIAFVYKISEFFGVPDHGANGYTARIVAATLGTALVGLPYFLRHHIGKLGAWLACFLLAISPSMVYFSRFTREDIYMAFFTLLLVVATAQYVRTRKVGWFIAGVLGFVLSYATKEATFLTIAVFGSFLGALVIWESSNRWPFPLVPRQQPVRDEQEAADDAPDVSTETRSNSSLLARFLPQTMAPLVLLISAIIFGLLARYFFSLLGHLAEEITKNPENGEIVIGQIKQTTVMLVPWIGILLAAIVGVFLVCEHLEIFPTEGRHGLARLVDPKKQPLLDTIVTMPWTHWFFGFVVGWTVFLVLFTALFTYVPNGIGDGIWQGLYYWLAQQEEARGGQPWYYYLTLIPLYEVFGVLFGLVGIVYCISRPSRFRLFLVWWFFGNFVIYSWAAEKMPWLMIHMTMPLMLLAAIGLRQVLLTLWRGIKQLDALDLARQGRLPHVVQRMEARFPHLAFPTQRATRGGAMARIVCGVLGISLALMTLLVSLQNMVQVTYAHPAEAQREMMIYVQTTPHVEETMKQIEEFDRKHYGGQRTVPIGVMDGAMWPYAWYLRDYTAVCFSFQVGGTCQGVEPPVILADSDHLANAQMIYSERYTYQKHEMRAQWNQGYMPPPCVPTPGKPCESQPYTGVGPLSWLSYGNKPPHPGAFDIGRIGVNVFTWWWTREPFGGFDIGYEFALLLHKNPAAKP